MAQRTKLPYINLTAFKGLYTKTSPEVITAEQFSVAENCDFFEKYGAVSKIKGSTTVLTTPYTEAAVVKPITWVGFHKAPDLDGTILRHTLVAAGTVLGRIDSGAVTTLATGRTNGLFHSATYLDRFSYISNYNPDKVGEGDALVKYDGAVITSWGITPPGGEETVIEAFDNAADWSTENCTVADESDVTWDGDAVEINKTGTDKRSLFIERNLPVENVFYVYGGYKVRDMGDSIPNRVKFLSYIPRGYLTATNLDSTRGLSTSKAAISSFIFPQVTAGFYGSIDNHWRFDYQLGDLVEGWNLLSMDFSAGPPGRSSSSPRGHEQGSFYPEHQAVYSTRYEFYLNKAASTYPSGSGIRMDRLHLLDQGAPVVNLTGTTGSFNGVYSYKVTYVSKYGNSSNAGPQSRDITASSTNSFALTQIPVSPDPQVIKRQLWRTVANGSVWLFLDEINDNTSTTYTDDTPDGSLSNLTPPQAGDFSDDNSIPPKAGIVKVWKRTVFMAGDPQNPSTLYFSEDDEPESFPLINIFELEGKITALYETYSSLIVETETGKYQVIGDNPDFSVDKIIDGIGCVGRRAAGTTRTIGYSVDRDGMRLWDSSDTSKISEPIRDKYETDIDKVNIEFMHTVHSKNRNTILEFNPSNAALDPVPTYDSIFGYMYPIDEIGSGFWTTINTPSAANLNFLDAEEIEDSNGDFKVYAGAEDGQVYELFNASATNWVNSAGTTSAIDTKFTTPYIRPGELGSETEGATGRVLPKHIEMRTEGDATTWTVTVETADGPSQTLARSSSVLSMQFGANNSLIRQAIPGSDLTPAEYFRVTARNNEASVSSTILALRIYFHVQEGQFENIAVDNVVS